MVILISQTFDSFKAAIHSEPETGCRPLYRASCTSGPEHAAKAVVRKYFGDAAAETVRQVKDAAEIAALTGDYFANPKRKQVFDVWAFNPRAKSSSAATVIGQAESEAYERAGAQLAKREAPSSLASCVLESCVSWDRARALLAGVKLAIRLSLAGQVMLGAELQQLKKDLGYHRGGDRRSNPQSVGLKSWGELVKEELGICDRTADRMIDSWEAAKAKLKKLGGQPALLGIMETPAGELDAIQRQTLEAAVGKVTDGETQKSLLEELKLVKCYDKSGIGGDTSAHRKPRTDEENVGQLAFMFFETVAEPLQRLCTQPDRTAYYIAMAEQHPAELSNLEQLLESTLHDVRAAKARRLTPAKA